MTDQPNVPGLNPGSRYPKPTAQQEAVRGSIAFFHPIIDALVLLFAIALFMQGFGLLALAVAFLAGRMGVR